MLPTDAPEHARPTRVLLVDDHALVRQGMAAIIGEEADMVICGEADGVRSAIATATRCAPDVALIDLSIHDGDGLELIREMRSRFPEVRCIVLSMYDEMVYAARAIRAGAHGYIMKAEAAKTVLSAIRSVLSGKVYVSERVASSLDGREAGGAASGKAGQEVLSDRELQVLRSIGRGLSSREIAEELFISVKTVEAHREHIKAKLGLASSGQLLRYAIEHNRVHA
jgi:DNA-binding NarL/FixJ family response regulator